MSKRNQSKPHKSHTFLYSELCLVVSPRVAKRQLRKAIASLGCYVHDFSLGGAFVWGTSPQGHDYWAELHTKIYQAKKVSHV